MRWWFRRRFISDCSVGRSCFDRHHRLQSPSRDGSRGSLCAEKGPLRLARQTASRWPPACSSAPETPPGPFSVLASPGVVLAAAPLSPTPTAPQLQPHASPASSEAAAGTARRPPLTPSRGRSRASGPRAARADRRRSWACRVRFIKVASDRSRGFINRVRDVDWAIRSRSRSIRREKAGFRVFRRMTRSVTAGSSPTCRLLAVERLPGEPRSSGRARLIDPLRRRPVRCRLQRLVSVRVREVERLREVVE